MMMHDWMAAREMMIVGLRHKLSSNTLSPEGIKHALALLKELEGSRFAWQPKTT